MKWIRLRKQQQIIYELIDYCSLILANVVKAFEGIQVQFKLKMSIRARVHLKVL